MSLPRFAPVVEDVVGFHFLGFLSLYFYILYFLLGHCKLNGGFEFCLLLLEFGIHKFGCINCHCFFDRLVWSL